MKRKIAIATAAAALLIGGGVTTGVALATDGGGRGPHTEAAAFGDHDDRGGSDDRDGGVDHGGGGDRGGDDTALAKAAKTSVQQAVDAGRQAAPGTVTSAELDHGTHGPVWSVETLAHNGTEHEVTVDAANAEVLGNRTDPDDDREGADLKAVQALRTDPRGAVTAALAKAPGTVTSVELDHERSAVSWEVEIQGKNGVEHDVTVNASTGKVTSASVDHDD
ncbi:PepSY domain-containing protein [Streptomyces gilvosporeus]|uniref:PepSY domain-containing protein n=1 Tax=Streptomyces gilvosporeus TaxID=553510 RepID=A0A1V0TZS6_9ACTN|nr:PepSY domain-containing protein [Streptomyces gilvosporeus]ARF58485.1 hypothetical protein B1H19_33680 [Streptomyces gilvosporeus]